METKVCKCCGKELPLTQFHKNRTMKDKHINICKECAKESRSGKRVSLCHKIPQPGIKATFRISDFEDNQLFAELRRRGYAGELHHSRVVTV